MDASGKKIKLLNALLAAASGRPAAVCADAESGIESALEELSQKNGVADVSSFAKNLLSIYNPSAEVEVLDFRSGHFDPLFVFPEIISAARRLSGAESAVLVVYGLDATLRGKCGRITKKRRLEYARGVEFIEDCAMRYKGIFKNLDIIFV